MPLDLLLDDVDHRPGRPAAGDVVEEVLEHLLAVLGVQHLGVPLHAGEPAVDVLERGDRRSRARAGEDGEARRAPRSRSRRGSSTTRSVLGQVRRAACPGSATLDRGCGRTRAAPVWATSPPSACGHRLEAVADAEHRARRPSNRAGSTWGAPGGVDRRRPAGQDDRLRLPGQHLLDRHRVRHDLGVDLRLAHAAGDQLGVLGAEVDDEDRGRESVTSVPSWPASGEAAESSRLAGFRTLPPSLARSGT